MQLSPTLVPGNADTATTFTSGVWFLPPRRVPILHTLGVGKPWYEPLPLPLSVGTDARPQCSRHGPVFIKPANPHLRFAAHVQTSFRELHAIYEARHVCRDARANALALPSLLELEDAGLLILPGAKTPDSVVPATPSLPSTPTLAPRYALRKSAEQRPSRRRLEAVDSAYAMLELLKPEVPVPLERGCSPSVQIVQMNLCGWTGAFKSVSQTIVPKAKEQAADDITVLDTPPENVLSKAHCKFYYLVSCLLGYNFSPGSHSPAGRDFSAKRCGPV
jgi:hypothetical protein